MYPATTPTLICSLWVTLVALPLAAQHSSAGFDAQQKRYALTAEPARQHAGREGKKLPGMPETVQNANAELAAPLLTEMATSGLPVLNVGPDSGSIMQSYLMVDSCNTWTVTGAPSWLATTVSGNLNVYLNYTQNLSDYPRTANLTVTGCGDTITLIVKQSGARLIASPGSADFLLRNVFSRGGCSDIGNVTFSGNNSQIGAFINGLTNVGFETGMILATGDIRIASGPNYQDNADGGFGIYTPDADLSQIANGQLFDVASIEFDITPTKPLLSFDFVFASEEYCEYVGSQYNDVFGFFISGPGIPGGQKNIALVPGTATPVTINSVNHLYYPNYYVNNQSDTSANLCGQQPNFGSSVNEVQYDGFTKALTAITNVEPCQTYHIKLKIGDVGDGNWDSAVLLKAGSLNAGGSSSVEWDVNGNAGSINEICEGCGTVKLVFHREGGDPNVQLPVSFTVSGTATMGVDYSTIQSPVIIPAGQEKLELAVNIFSDIVAEGIETIVITPKDSCSCYFQQKILNIKDLVLDLAPPCPANNYPAADLCSDICIFCTFNGYQGSTSGYSGQTPPGFCGTIENEQWLGFIAGAAAATFTATPENCANGDGIQIALYTSCNSDPVVCNGGCSGCGTNPQSVTSALIPGVNYFVLIDGYAGDQCDFNIDVIPPSAVQAQGVGLVGVISGPSTTCPGAVETFSIPTVTGAGGYLWNAPPGFRINGQEPPVLLSVPEGNTVQVSIGSNGGMICVKPLNSCNDGVEKCKAISVAPIPPTVLPPLTVCAEDLPFETPWGDHVSTSGTFPHTYTSYQGCDSLVFWKLTVKPPIIKYLAPQTICTGSCITICGEEYCNAGAYTHTCESYQGCDSIINFSVIVMDPIAEITSTGILSCVNDTIILNSGPSTGTKSWQLNGSVVGTGNSVIITQPGTVVLTVTASAGGAFCMASDTLIITGNTTPPSVTATGDTLGCGATQAQLNAITNALNPAYLWSPTTGLSAANIANPIAPAPGSYTVVVTDLTNGCTASATVTVPGLAATASGGTLTCSATAIQINAVTNASTPGFLWSGPGGFNSTDQNPIVTAPGIYTLTVTDQSGCTLTATATVTDDCNSAPPWNVDTTSSNHTIILPTTLTGDIHAGDYLGVFYDSSGTLKCGGYGIWSDTLNQAFAAFGNDAPAPNQNGFNPGEAFKIKIWRPAILPNERAASGQYAPVGSLSGLVTHTDKFAVDGISMITAITLEATQAIPLKNGWNLISAYVQPNLPAMPDIFDPIISSITLVKNCDGASYIPQLMSNSIGNWNLVEGYQVKTNKKDTLLVMGQQAVPGDHPIPLHAGWQCIAYLRRTPLAIETVFNPILGQISAVKDGDGRTYLPQFNINDIGYMIPGQGYKVKALSNTALTYNNNFVNPSDERAKYSGPAHTTHFTTDHIVNTGNNATLILTSSTTGSALHAGDEIGFFSAANKLCGAAKYLGQNLAITVWGDDPSTIDIAEGMKNGEVYSLKVWNSSEQEEYPAWATLSSGKSAYEQDAIEEIGNIQLGSVGANELSCVDIQSLKLFPNPTSESLNLGIESSHSGKVSLAVFNSDGMRVWSLKEIEYRTGNTIRSLDIPAELSSGMYWFRLQFEKGIVYRRVFIQK